MPALCDGHKIERGKKTVLADEREIGRECCGRHSAADRRNPAGYGAKLQGSRRRSGTDARFRADKIFAALRRGSNRERRWARPRFPPASGRICRAMRPANPDQRIGGKLKGGGGCLVGSTGGT